MEILTVDIDSLKPYENNAKEHPQEQIEQIKKSILDYGNNDPIAVDENNIIIEGHGRYTALKELGYKTVDIIRLEHLTEEQKKSYRLIHNKLTMNSDFDFEMLEKELEELTAFDVDMSLFGFDNSIFDDETEGEKTQPKPEIEFTKSVEEKHNYIVLYFENEIDWLQAQSVFDICKVKELSTRKDGSIPKKPRYGIGRVLNGAKALSKIIGENF